MKKSLLSIFFFNSFSQQSPANAIDVLHNFKKVKNQYLILALLLAFSCTKKETDPIEPIISSCEQNTTISVELYQSESDSVNIDSLMIDGNCLNIYYGASGCDGNSWEVQLYDSGNILESSPPQRNIRLVMNNPEICEAYFTKETSFDISNLQVEGSQLLLNLSDTDLQVLYDY